MNRTTLILGATTLVFGSASAYLYSDLRESRTQSAELQTRVEQLEQSAAEMSRAGRHERNHKLPANPFGSVSADEGLRPPPKAPPSPAAAAAVFSSQPAVTTGSLEPKGMVNGRGGWERSRKLLEDPDYRDAMKRQQKLMMPRMYPDLQTALQIDDQQADQLLDLLAEQQIRNMANRPPFTARGEAPDEATLRDWRAQQQLLQSENQAEIASLLGDENARQWKDYQSTLAARSQIRELRSSLEGAGLPLQSDQTEKLVAAITAEQQKSLGDVQNNRYLVGASAATGNRPAMFERQIELTKQQQQRVRTAASTYLSSEQMAYLERIQANQLEMQQINLKMMRAQAEAEARGDLPPVNQTIVER